MTEISVVDYRELSLNPANENTNLKRILILLTGGMHYENGITTPTANTELRAQAAAAILKKGDLPFDFLIISGGEPKRIHNVVTGRNIQNIRGMSLALTTARFLKKNDLLPASLSVLIEPQSWTTSMNARLSIQALVEKLVPYENNIGHLQVVLLTSGPHLLRAQSHFIIELATTFGIFANMRIEFSTLTAESIVFEEIHRLTHSQDRDDQIITHLSQLREIHYKTYPNQVKHELKAIQYESLLHGLGLVFVNKLMKTKYRVKERQRPYEFNRTYN